MEFCDEKFEKNFGKVGFGETFDSKNAGKYKKVRLLPNRFFKSRIFMHLELEGWACDFFGGIKFEKKNQILVKFLETEK